MPRYVVDASVIAKWVLPGEPYEENALRLKNDSVIGLVELHSPEILRCELGNILWKAFRASRLLSGNAFEALNAISAMRVNLHQQDWTNIIEAYRIATKLGLTVYDATYIRLGDLLGIPFLTADESVWKIARASRHQVVHLRDY
jgi:predicted nucleic acid-binding protein